MIMEVRSPEATYILLLLLFVEVHTNESTPNLDGTELVLTGYRPPDKRKESLNCILIGSVASIASLAVELQALPFIRVQRFDKMAIDGICHRDGHTS